MINSLVAIPDLGARSGVAGLDGVVRPEKTLVIGSVGAGERDERSRSAISATGDLDLSAREVDLVDRRFLVSAMIAIAR